MKIIAVTTCGSYESWTQWTVASIYNAVDKVIVINGGINISLNNDLIGLEDNIPLKRELNQLKEIDVNNKIIQIRPDWKNTKYANPRTCESGRGRNISLAFQSAYKAGADYIIKLDSDQICDESFTRKNLEELANDNRFDGVRFAEYSDFFRRYDRVQALPDKFTDDGALFFKANKNAWATGGGSPVHYRDQYEIYHMRTFHMRRIHPPDLDEFQYHYKRFFYHFWGPNSIGELEYNRKTGKRYSNEQIHKMAASAADNLMKSEGYDSSHFDDDERFPPKIPDVVVQGPLNYILNGQ